MEHGRSDKGDECCHSVCFALRACGLRIIMFQLSGFYSGFRAQGLEFRAEFRYRWVKVGTSGLTCPVQCLDCRARF